MNIGFFLHRPVSLADIDDALYKTANRTLRNMPNVNVIPRKIMQAAFQDEPCFQNQECIKQKAIEIKADAIIIFGIEPEFLDNASVFKPSKHNIFGTITIMSSDPQVTVNETIKPNKLGKVKKQLGYKLKALIPEWMKALQQKKEEIQPSANTIKAQPKPQPQFVIPTENTSHDNMKQQTSNQAKENRDQLEGLLQEQMTLLKTSTAGKEKRIDLNDNASHNNNTRFGIGSILFFTTGTALGVSSAIFWLSVNDLEKKWTDEASKTQPDPNLLTSFEKDGQSKSKTANILTSLSALSFFATAVSLTVENDWFFSKNHFQRSAVSLCTSSGCELAFQTRW